MKPRLIELARLISFKSTDDIKIGAVLSKKGRALSLGWNFMKKSHTKSPHPWRFIHAEFHCLTGVPEHLLEGADMYVYREDLNGEMADSKPCSHCENMLRMAGLKRVFYSSRNGMEGMKL